jgi:transposase
MDSHKNARLTPKGREAMVRSVVDSGLSNAATARRFNTTPKTAAKWVERFRTQGVDGLRDRSSRPLSSPSQTAPAICVTVEALRRARHTGKQIAAELHISPATVSRILQRRGLNKLSALEPAEPVRRYEREKPGEMIHVDIKKLGRFNKIGHRITSDRRGQSNSRGVGWEYVHVAIDDHSRIAFAKVMPSEKKRSATTFLKAAVAYYESLGIKVERAMTDNGSCYKSFAFRRAASASDCDTYEPSHIRRGPTARRNASSKPPCVSGPMPRPTRTQTSEKLSCRPGCIATTGIGHTPESMIRRPSVASVFPRTTS